MAPQSTVRNGAADRALSWCTARAARLLPVPVSPSTSTTTSLAAARSITAKQARIASERPTNPPSSVRDDTGSAVRCSAGRKRSDTRPSCSTLPARRYASRTSTPSRTVPLRLPRSTMRAPDPSFWISQ